MRGIIVISFLLFVSCLLAVPVSAETDSVRMERVMVPTPEGVGLATDIYYPADDSLPAPVVMMRLPYGSKGREWFGRPLARAGYVVLIQNVRGQNGSEGRFIPFWFEARDGAATVLWLTEQQWFDGRIGLWGSSYAGYCSFETARTGSDQVKSIFHISGWSDLEPFLAHDGAFRLMAHLRWFYTYASGQSAPPEEAWDGIFRTTPLSSFFKGAGDMINEMLKPAYPYDRFSFPVLHVTGWYDYIYPMVLETYDSLSAQSNPPEQHLLVGPWSHNGFLNGWTKVGDEDFGEKVKVGIDSVMTMTVNWFDYSIKGVQNVFGESPPVKVFVMGENRWHEYSQWPPKETDSVKWYLAAGGPANSASGRGLLVREFTENTSPIDTFTYDPHDPVPTYGGALFHFFPKLLGPRNQLEIEQRDDVLVYTSAPLETEMRLVGPVRAVVYAATTGKDTDFTAKLCDVRPDGYVRHIVDGIVRGSYLFADNGEEPVLEAGKVYRFEIDLGSTGYVLAEGHRLRLDISSGNVPRFDRNPNTGVDPMEATEFESVRQTVYHSPDYPSHVIVPLKP